MIIDECYYSDVDEQYQYEPFSTHACEKVFLPTNDHCIESCFVIQSNYMCVCKPGFVRNVFWGNSCEPESICDPRESRCLVLKKLHNLFQRQLSTHLIHRLLEAMTIACITVIIRLLYRLDVTMLTIFGMLSIVKRHPWRNALDVRFR